VSFCTCPDNGSHFREHHLKPEEHVEMVSAIAAGDRVKATRIYLSATEGNLTEAQNFIKTLTVEAETAQSKRSSKKRRCYRSKRLAASGLP
jgi:hypothetical protein